MSQKSALDRIAEAKAREAYEFERPIRDALGAAIAVQSMLHKAVAMGLIARCMDAKPTDLNREPPPC
jgi:hypothetical protein